MKKSSFLTISLVIIPLWWIFQAVWSSGFVHTLAQNSSPAIDRAISYATRGTTQYDDIYFTHAEISHLVDVSHLYSLSSTILNIAAAVAWGFLVYALYTKSDMTSSLRLGGKILGILVMALFVAAVFFSLSFEWFHRILFPQGNWAFPADAMLIQLFPEWFWRLQLLCIMGLLSAFAGLYWFLSDMKRT